MAVYTADAVISTRDLNTTVQGGTTVTGTSAGTTLVTVTLPSINQLYEVAVYAFVSGTVTATEANNMVLKQGTTTLMTLPIVQSASVGPVPVKVIVNSGTSQTITVVVGAATPGASAGYNVSVVATQISV